MSEQDQAPEPTPEPRFPEQPPLPPEAPQPASAQPGPSYQPAAPYGVRPPQPDSRPPASGGQPPYGMPPYGMPPYGYGYPPQPPRKSRAWLWFLLGALAFLVLTIGGCAVTLAGFFSSFGSGFSEPGMTSGDAVAVIHIDQAIAGTGGTVDGVVTPESIRTQLERAADDPNVKAVVLRVDSPGGTVAASEEIATYVRDFGKPVVVSIGDVGASGAYMVSSQADEIYALPGSAVGSIGVILEIPNVSGLLDKVGVDFTVITAGTYKDAGSPFRSLTPSETALLKGQVDEVYGQFIDIVAKGRDLKRADVEKLATGLTWNGVKAKELGLIDKVGTYTDALDRAAELGGIKDKDYEVVSYDESSFDTALRDLLGVKGALDTLKALGGAGRLDTRSALPR